MDKLASVFSQVGDIRARLDDNLVDRLNHRYTTLLLVVFSMIVSANQYMGEPIRCWCPAYFTDAHIDFATRLCWVSNNYYIPITNKLIPGEGEPRHQIVYYQWVPLILLTQALLFHLPCIFWRFFNTKAGLNLHNLVETAMSLHMTSTVQDRSKTMRYMAKNMDRYLGSTREYRAGFYVNCRHFLSRNVFRICGRRYGNFLVVLYICSKLLYIVNSVGQLFFLNIFLGQQYHVYGIDVIKQFMKGEDWPESEMFPRITLCDFKIRHLGNLHRHSIQCVLSINHFNEKIYIFIWFWYVFLSLANVINAIMWLFRCLIRWDQERFIEGHIDLLNTHTNRHLSEPMHVNKFLTGYLRPDGILVLRLIGSNTDELLVAELTNELYIIAEMHGFTSRVVPNKKDDLITVQNENQDLRPTAPPIEDTDELDSTSSQLTVDVI